MLFTIVASARAQHQLSHQSALAKGLKKLGVDSALSHSVHSVNTKHVACWGWRAGKELRARGHEVLVLERGYLGDRFAWTSLAWNGLNGRATFAQSPDDGGERFRNNFSMKPWRDGGDYVLIMGQVPGDASLQGKNMMPWYSQVAAAAGREYALPVMFRAHPVAIKKGYKQKPSYAHTSKGTLDEALAGAAVVITYNSNSGVDSVLAGVPTIACDPGSMAYNVCGQVIGDIYKPDREKWADDLACKQWRIDEIESGVAIEPLLEIANG